jgi:hypothetical protein
VKVYLEKCIQDAMAIKLTIMTANFINIIDTIEIPSHLNQ